MIGKIFDGVILVRTLLTRLIIFCKTILGTQVIVISIIDPGDTLHAWVKIMGYLVLTELIKVALGHLTTLML